MQYICRCSNRIRWLLAACIGNCENLTVMYAIMHMQDTTNHPAWTGEKKAMVGDDSRAAQFLRKYDNLRTPNPQEK